MAMGRLRHVQPSLTRCNSCSVGSLNVLCRTGLKHDGRRRAPGRTGIGSIRPRDPDTVYFNTTFDSPYTERNFATFPSSDAGSLFKSLSMLFFNCGELRILSQPPVIINDLSTADHDDAQLLMLASNKVARSGYGFIQSP